MRKYFLDEGEKKKAEERPQKERDEKKAQFYELIYQNEVPTSSAPPLQFYL